jgi:periplasmic divalent cation tolerance protein
MPPEILIVYSTCPDEESAARIAEDLVTERLAACVNLLPALTSFFLWRDKLEKQSETLLLIKTTSARLGALTERLRELHPYEVPEIIATPVTGGLPEYVQWVRACASLDA